MKIAGLLVIFDWSLGALQAVELPKSLWSRATAWLLVALVAIALARYGWRVLPRTRLHLIVVANLVAVGLATALADNRYLALFGDQNRYLGLTFTADMAILYAATTIAFRAGRDVRLLAAVVAAASGLVLAYALLQAAGLDPVRWSEDPRGRPFSSLGNPDVLGHLISLLIGLAVGAAAFGSDLSVRARGAAAAFAVAALGVGSLVATRGTALGLLAVVAAAPFVLARAGGIAALRSRLTLLAGAAAVLALAVVLTTSPLGARVRDTLAGTGVTADRLVVYQAAFEGFRARPVLGYGPDSFGAVFALHSPPETARVLGTSVADDSAHNWVLHALATTGIVGTLALAALACAQVVVGVRVMARSPALGAAIALGSAAYWAHGLVSVGSVAVDWWPWLGLGLVAALPKSSVAPLSPVRRLSPVVAWAAIGIALLLGAAGLNALQANQDARRTRVAPDAQSAQRFAERAVARDSGRADYWNELGRARFRGQDWPGSARAFEQATSRAPHVARYWSNLALARVRQVAAGDARARGPALAAAERAVQAQPNAPDPRARLAEVASALGEHQRAIAAASAAYELSGRREAYLPVLSRAHEAAGDLAGAIEWERRLVDGETSPASKLRLAQLHVAAGQPERARELLPPPRVAGVSFCGSRVCFLVTVSSVADLGASATDPARYRINGQPLPPGSSVTLERAGVVTVDLPAARRLFSGDRVEVSGLRDVFGTALIPDPASFTVP